MQGGSGKIFLELGSFLILGFELVDLFQELVHFGDDFVLFFEGGVREMELIPIYCD